MNLKTSLVLIAAVGASLAAWRAVHDLDPLVAAIRQLRGGGTVDDRRAAMFVVANSDASRADDLLPMLAERASDPDPEVRRAATSGMVRMLGLGKPPGAADATRLRVVMDHVIGEIDDPNATVRASAMDFLFLLLTASGADPGRAVDALARALGAAEPFVRVKAARTLGLCGALPGVRPPGSLVRALGDPELDVRMAAGTALPCFKAGFDRAVAPLLLAIADDPELARHCSRAVSEANPGPAAVPDLIAALSSPSWRSRSLAATLLGSVARAEPWGLEVKSAVPVLLETLKRSLAEPMPDRPEMFARVQEVEDPVMAVVAALSVIGIEPDRLRLEVISPLGVALRSADARRVDVICQLLNQFGPLAEPTIPDLIAVATIKANRTEGYLAAHALAFLATGIDSAPSAIAALGWIMKDDSALCKSDPSLLAQIRRLEQSAAQFDRGSTGTAARQGDSP